MKRLHLIEVEDLTQLPSSIRSGVTDFLEFAVVTFGIYRNVSPRLYRILKLLREKQIVDLCSGSGGPWKSLCSGTPFADQARLHVYLTDLYPNPEAWKRLLRCKSIRFSSVQTPTSALEVPGRLKGFRTLFSSFHHFPPNQARKILIDAVEKGEGIGIFESTQRHPLMLLYMLATPFLVILATPMLRPFRWSRILWTYLLPIIPLAVMFDGLVSCMRTYTVQELADLTNGLGENKFRWEVGLERFGRMPVGITYLIGYPANK